MKEKINFWLDICVSTIAAIFFICFIVLVDNVETLGLYFLVDSKVTVFGGFTIFGLSTIIGIMIYNLTVFFIWDRKNYTRRITVSFIILTIATVTLTIALCGIVNGTTRLLPAYYFNNNGAKVYELGWYAYFMIGAYISIFIFSLGLYLKKKTT